MMRFFVVACLAVAVAFQLPAQSPSSASSDVPVRIKMPSSQLTDILKLYKQLSKRKVWLDADLPFDRKISVSTERDVSRTEALSLIRSTLLQEGIEIREVGDTEAFVSRVAR
jgi:hypothetical protein